MEYTITSLFNKSLAYLEVAILSSKAKNSVMYNTSEYLNVIVHLLPHTTELFFIFVICFLFLIFIFYVLKLKKCA